MSQTQFFTKSSDNLQDYKTNFKKALTRIKTVKLFSDEVINFLESWIDSQTSYIPRSDVENLWKHLELVYKDKEFYDYLENNLKQVKKSSNILEYSFNLISEVDELAKKYSEYKKKKQFEGNLEKQKLQDKKESEKELNKIMNEL